MRETTSIYIVGYGNMMKVGLSRNPLNRLAQMQTGVPEELRFHYLCILPSREAAMKMEAAIHKKLAHRRVRGEWFRIDAEDAAEAAALVVRRWARRGGKASGERRFANVDEMVAALGAA